MDKIAGIMTLLLPTLIIAGYYWLVIKDIKNARETGSRIRIKPISTIMISVFVWFGLIVLFARLFGVD